MGKSMVKGQSLPTTKKQESIRSCTNYRRASYGKRRTPVFGFMGGILERNNP
jgi:hypothetical protein